MLAKLLLHIIDIHCRLQSAILTNLIWSIYGKYLLLTTAVTFCSGSTKIHTNKYTVSTFFLRQR
jgi:hypothetical protein